VRVYRGADGEEEQEGAAVVEVDFVELGGESEEEGQDE